MEAGSTSTTERETSSDADELVALRAIMEGTAQKTGDEFFRALVEQLSAATGVPNVFVAEFMSPHTARSLASWSKGQLQPTAEWDIRGNPCEKVIHGDLCQLEIAPELLPIASVPAAPPMVAAAPIDGNLEALERQHIINVLRQSQGVIEGPSGAAKVLGLHPNTLRSRMKKLQITRATLDDRSSAVAHDPS
jgi:hypothetical protein